MASRKKKKPKTAGQRFAKVCTVISIIGVILFGAREYVSYTTNPKIASLRDVFIETACTTHSHNWIAGICFPRSVINRVVERINEQTRAQAAMESTWSTNAAQTTDNKKLTGEEWFKKVYWELDSPSMNTYLKENPDVLENGYENIKIDNMKAKKEIYTTEGDQVLMVDCANNVFLIETDGSGYKGKMAFVKNPEQVKHVLSKSFGSYGEEVETFAKDYGAVFAINCSPFEDVGGHGSGAHVRSACIVDGVDYGHVVSSMKLYAMDYENRLFVTNYSKDTVSKYRWGTQFFPAMIIDGKNVLSSESGGQGIQPRTVIGQQSDKTFMMLIIEGRGKNGSLGTTVGECANIMERYKALQAGALDGGSSAVMYYNGEQIIQASSVSGKGRYGPDALIVIPADEVNGWTDKYSKFPKNK